MKITIYVTAKDARDPMKAVREKNFSYTRDLPHNGFCKVVEITVDHVVFLENIKE